MTEILDCKYAGAVAWGKRYPDTSGGRENATNGSAPGYVLVPEDAMTACCEAAR